MWRAVEIGTAWSCGCQGSSAMRNGKISVTWQARETGLRSWEHDVTNRTPRGPQLMPNLSSIMRQLKKERDRAAKQLSGMDAALRAFAGVYSGTNGKRQISAAGRKSIAAAQRARWAKVKGTGNQATTATPVRRTMSASARRKISAAQRARWAKVNRGKSREK